MINGALKRTSLIEHIHGRDKSFGLAEETIKSKIMINANKTNSGTCTSIDLE
jgi:hypothetical protein